MKDMSLLDLLSNTDLSYIDIDLLSNLYKSSEIFKESVFVETDNTDFYPTIVRKCLHEFTLGETETKEEVDIPLEKVHFNENNLEQIKEKFLDLLFFGKHYTLSLNKLISSYYSSHCNVRSSENNLDFGGRKNENSSIWLCGWSESTLKWTINFERKPHNETVANIGLVLKDWRYVTRISQVNKIEEYEDKQEYYDKLIRLMIASYNKIPSNRCNLVWYMNEEIWNILDKLEKEYFNVHLTRKDGVLYFIGIPLRKVEQLKFNEGNF